MAPRQAAPHRALWPRVKGVAWVDPVAVLIYGPNVLYGAILDRSCWLVISFFPDSGVLGNPLSNHRSRKLASQRLSIWFQRQNVEDG